MNPRWLNVPVLIVWVCGAFATPAGFAAEPEAPTVEMTKVPVQGTQALLAEVLRRVQGAPRKPFIVEERISPWIVTGGPLPSPVSYKLLATLLTAYRLAIIETEVALVIATDESIRTRAIPTISSIDEKRLDDEWVSYVFTPSQVAAPILVPILRPLLPQAAHLVALPDKNTLLIVDRFANVKRLVSIVRSFERVKPAAAATAK